MYLSIHGLQVQKVKRDYEKLSKRHQKQAKESRHDKETASLVLQDNASELAHTKDKVEVSQPHGLSFCP